MCKLRRRLSAARPGWLEIVEPICHRSAQRPDRILVRLKRRAVGAGAVGAYMTRPVVLIVEDEILVRLTAVFLLEEAGFATLEAGSADEAIKLLEARKDIQVVFTDINMPGSMDGLRLAHSIRHRWPPVQLVLTSGRRRIPNEG